MNQIIKTAALLMAIATTTGCTTRTAMDSLTPQEKLTVNDTKINDLIAQMSLEEKVEMLHSKTIMSSEGVPRLQSKRYSPLTFSTLAVSLQTVYWKGGRDPSLLHFMEKLHLF